MATAMQAPSEGKASEFVSGYVMEGVEGGLEGNDGASIANNNSMRPLWWYPLVPPNVQSGFGVYNLQPAMMQAFRKSLAARIDTAMQQARDANATDEVMKGMGDKNKVFDPRGGPRGTNADNARAELQAWVQGEKIRMDQEFMMREQQMNQANQSMEMQQEETEFPASKWGSFLGDRKPLKRPQQMAGAPYPASSNAYAGAGNYQPKRQYYYDSQGFRRWRYPLQYGRGRPPAQFLGDRQNFPGERNLYAGLNAASRVLGVAGQVVTNPAVRLGAQAVGSLIGGPVGAAAANAATGIGGAVASGLGSLAGAGRNFMNPDTSRVPADYWEQQNAAARAGWPDTGGPRLQPNDPMAPFDARQVPGYFQPAVDGGPSMFQQAQDASAVRIADVNAQYNAANPPPSAEQPPGPSFPAPPPPPAGPQQPPPPFPPDDDDGSGPSGSGGGGGAIAAAPLPTAGAPPIGNVAPALSPAPAPALARAAPLDPNMLMQLINRAQIAATKSTGMERKRWQEIVMGYQRRMPYANLLDIGQDQAGLTIATPQAMNAIFNPATLALGAPPTQGASAATLPQTPAAAQNPVQAPSPAALPLVTPAPPAPRINRAARIEEEDDEELEMTEQERAALEDKKRGKRPVRPGSPPPAPSFDPRRDRSPSPPAGGGIMKDARKASAKAPTQAAPAPGAQRRQQEQPKTQPGSTKKRKAGAQFFDEVAVEDDALGEIPDMLIPEKKARPSEKIKDLNAMNPGELLVTYAMEEANIHRQYPQQAAQTNMATRRMLAAKNIFLNKTKNAVLARAGWLDKAYEYFPPGNPGFSKIKPYLDKMEEYLDTPTSAFPSSFTVVDLQPLPSGAQVSSKQGGGKHSRNQQ